MVDVTDSFIEKAKTYLAEDAKRVQNFFVKGLEAFEPAANNYDCIWMQWVLGYLSDDDLVAFFKRCKAALKPNGICVIKDNMAKKEREFDEVDSSFTRTRDTYVELINKAGMTIVAEDKQRKFPQELYEVRFFAFK